MGACYNEGFRRGNTSSTRNRRKINSSDKDSISTQSYDKKKGKNYILFRIFFLDFLNLMIYLVLVICNE